MIIKRVGHILTTQGEHLFESQRITKLMPLTVSEDRRVIERKQIIKAYNTMQNELQKNYTNSYMGTVYSLLSMNEKRYHIKRNKLSFRTYKQFDNDYYNKGEEEKKASYLPTESNKTNIRKLILKLDSTKKKTVLERKPVLLHTTRHKRDKNNILKGLSVENTQLLQMINQSDEYIQIHRQQYKDQVMKRLLSIKANVPVSTPVKLKEYTSNYSLSSKKSKETLERSITLNSNIKHKKAYSRCFFKSMM